MDKHTLLFMYVPLHPHERDIHPDVTHEPTVAVRIEVMQGESPYDFHAHMIFHENRHDEIEECREMDMN